MIKILLIFVSLTDNYRHKKTNDAHWSNLVGATHKTENAFFELGQTTL